MTKMMAMQGRDGEKVLKDFACYSEQCIFLVVIEYTILYLQQAPTKEIS